MQTISPVLYRMKFVNATAVYIFLKKISPILIRLPRLRTDSGRDKKRMSPKDSVSETFRVFLYSFARAGVFCGGYSAALAAATS